MPKKRPAPSAEQQLAQFRQRIDALDDKLIRLLIDRIAIVQQVASLKAEHWPNSCHIRSGREGQMHQRIAKAFAGSGFSPWAALGIWRQLIGASTNVESALRIAYLASEPHHYWLAREYFGPLVNLTSIAAPSLVETSNVLVLPAPDEPGVSWWRNPIIYRNAPLMLFARLPLVNEEMPGEVSPAVTLAPITPEPSADDISYFLIKTASTQAPTLKSSRIISYGHDHLLILSGFVTLEDARIRELQSAETHIHWLGAHPRPLNLGELV